MAQKATLGVAPNLSLMIPNLNIAEKNTFPSMRLFNPFFETSPLSKKIGWANGLERKCPAKLPQFSTAFYTISTAICRKNTLL